MRVEWNIFSIRRAWFNALVSSLMRKAQAFPITWWQTSSTKSSKTSRSTSIILKNWTPTRCQTAESCSMHEQQLQIAAEKVAGIKPDDLHMQILLNPRQLSSNSPLFILRHYITGDLEVTVVLWIGSHVWLWSLYRPKSITKTFGCKSTVSTWQERLTFFLNAIPNTCNCQT